MNRSPDETLHEIRRTLDRWHATHPDATFLEMEEAVEAQLPHLRASLVSEHTDRTFAPEHPTCRECGARMEPRTRRERHIVLSGDEAVTLRRS